MQFDQLKRREFITLLGGAAAAWPVTASAQQSAKLPTIGFLGGATASAWSNWSAAFVQRLRELGWSEGRTVSIEYRWAEGRHERAAEIAAEFVRLKVDVIVTSGGIRGPVARRVTFSTEPAVCTTIRLAWLILRPVATRDAGAIMPSLGRPHQNGTHATSSRSRAQCRRSQ